MKTSRFRAAALGVVLACAAATPCRAEEEPRAPLPGPFQHVLFVEFDSDIDGVMLAYVKRRIEEARASGVDCLVLRFDSPGGTVYHSKEIGDLVLALPEGLHTVAWIPKEALSGAAFVALACDEILMVPGATLGDAQPIVGGMDGKPEPVGEKMESPLRAWFTAYAQRNGYPVLLAQAMVSVRMEVLRVAPRAGGEPRYVEADDFRKADDEAEIFPGLRKADLRQVGGAVVSEGELLTMTGEEALELGFVRRRVQGGLPRTEADVIAALAAPGAQVRHTEMSTSERASKWLMLLSGILSAIVAMSVLVFMWQGPGLMTIVGGAALAVVLLINVTADQLHGFPIFLLLLGAGLMAVEAFLVPGFGVPGILGIASMAAGFLFLATGSTWGSTQALDGASIKAFGMQFVFTTIAVFVAMVVLSRFLPRVGPARRMILVAPATTFSPAVYVEAPPPAVGSEGKAVSDLRPAGSVEIAGELVDAVSEGGYVPAGALVEVVALEGRRVTVRPRPHEPADEAPA